MNILIDESFEKDIKKIIDNKLLNLIADCLEEISDIVKLSKRIACKKLKGSKKAYSIRIGNYRIGFIFEN